MQPARSHRSRPRKSHAGCCSCRRPRGLGHPPWSSWKGWHRGRSFRAGSCSGGPGSGGNNRGSSGSRYSAGQAGSGHRAVHCGRSGPKRRLMDARGGGQQYRGPWPGALVVCCQPGEDAHHLRTDRAHDRGAETAPAPAARLAHVVDPSTWSHDLSSVVLSLSQ